MEAAKPIEPDTPKVNENNDIKMIDIKKFDINLDNKKYILEFAKSEDKKKIIFKISENNNFMPKYFSLYLNIDDFYSLNVLFRLYQTIDEIYSFLLDILIGNKYSVKSKDNKFILILQIPMPGGKIIDINFELLENKIEKNDLIEKLYSTVDKLLKENNLIKDEHNKMKKELDILKEENNQLKNKLINIEVFVEQKKKEEYKKYFDLSKSYILEDKEEKKRVKKWVSSITKVKSINLLYRATEDGDSSDAFFYKCANQGPTLSLIKTKKGRRFGGFSRVEWKYDIIKIKDKNSFLFSLDDMKKYNISKPEDAISCYPGIYCLVYGNNADSKGIYLHNGFLNRVSKENHCTRVYNVSSDFCLSGESEFYVEEVEVYQVIFDY